MIQRAEPCSAGWHFMFLQYPSEYIHSLGGQRDGAVPAQAVQYFGRRQPFSLLVISGNAEIVVEQLLFGRYLFEIVVVFRHNPFVRLVEPIAFAVVQFVHGLGIKLVVVYRAVGVYCFRHFYADEPASAAPKRPDCYSVDRTWTVTLSDPDQSSGTGYVCPLQYT